MRFEDIEPGMHLANRDGSHEVEVVGKSSLFWSVHWSDGSRQDWPAASAENWEPTGYFTKATPDKVQFSSGMVRNGQAGKARFDLCVPEALAYEDQMLTRFAALMERGAVTHAERNWELASGPEELSRAKSSAFRHFMQWYCGVQDGEDHAAAVYFNIMCAEYVKARMNQGEQGQ